MMPGCDYIIFHHPGEKYTQLRQPSEKMYCSMSSIGPKILIMINNYASYDKQTLWS